MENGDLLNVLLILNLYISPTLEFGFPCQEFNIQEMDKNLKKQNRWGKKEGEKPDTQVDDAHLGMGQLKWRNVNKKVVFPIVL